MVVGGDRVAVVLLRGLAAMRRPGPIKLGIGWVFFFFFEGRGQGWLAIRVCTVQVALGLAERKSGPNGQVGPCCVGCD